MLAQGCCGSWESRCPRTASEALQPSWLSGAGLARDAGDGLAGASSPPEDLQGSRLMSVFSHVLAAACSLLPVPGCAELTVERVPAETQMRSITRHALKSLAASVRTCP